VYPLCITSVAELTEGRNKKRVSGPGSKAEGPGSVRLMRLPGTSAWGASWTSTDSSEIGPVPYAAEAPQR